MTKSRNKIAILLLMLCVPLVIFTAQQVITKWSFIFPGGLAYNENRVCKKILKQSYGGVFSHMGPGGSGKPSIILSDGVILPTYGILRHVSTLEKGDSLWKPANSLDYYVIKVKSPDEIITLPALESLPCK